MYKETKDDSETQVNLNEFMHRTNHLCALVSPSIINARAEIYLFFRFVELTGTLKLFFIIANFAYFYVIFAYYIYNVSYLFSIF